MFAAQLFSRFSFTLTQKQVTCENVSVKESRKEIMTMDGHQGVNTINSESKSSLFLKYIHLGYVLFSLLLHLNPIPILRMKVCILHVDDV